MMGNRNGLYLVTVWVTVFIAILGFIFSYITLAQVAASFQMHRAQVIIFPLLLDLFMVVAHSAYFYLSRIGADRRLVTVIMYLTVGLSVVFNLDHVWPTDDWLMLTAWGLPPVILLLSVKTITVMVRTHQEPEAAQPETHDTQPPRIDAAEPAHQCGLCGEPFDSAQKKAAHMRWQHPQPETVNSNGKT